MGGFIEPNIHPVLVHFTYALGTSAALAYVAGLLVPAGRWRDSLRPAAPGFDRTQTPEAPVEMPAGPAPMPAVKGTVVKGAVVKGIVRHHTEVAQDLRRSLTTKAPKGGSAGANIGPDGVLVKASGTNESQPTNTIQLILFSNTNTPSHQR